MNNNKLQIIFYSFLFTVVILTAMVAGAAADRLFVIKPLDYFFDNTSIANIEQKKLIREESVVIDVAERISPSVVTVSIKTPQRRILRFSPFGGFSSDIAGGEQQDIGSGFIVEGGPEASGRYVVTNKHVVDSEGEYKVVTQDGEEHDVINIVRDPLNDLAIVEVEGISDYDAIPLGDSDQLKVGQFVIAIGTALGEFRHTVTTGVVSGLGRGIVAGSSFEGYVERLDNVIQTDAAINPGNSGGPLLNSSGEVIGVNVAVAAGAENVGFALPINLVRDGLAQFNDSGMFASKAYLGVEHTIISREAAILNELPQGAYISRVVEGSAADNAGILAGDIITKVDGKLVSESEDGLAGIIASKNIGDTISIELYRETENGEVQNLTLNATLSGAVEE